MPPHNFCHPDHDDDDGDDASGGGIDVDDLQPPSSFLGTLTDIFTMLEFLILKYFVGAI